MINNDIREVVAVKADDIIITNSNLNRKTIKKIKSAFNFSDYAFPMGYISSDGVILTDGNHRATALIELGEKYIPIVPLTKNEFDHVAYSKRTVDLNVRMPEKLRVVRCPVTA